MERETKRQHAEGSEPRPHSKKRKKKQKRSPLFNSVLYIVTVFAVSMVLAALGWSLANDLLALNKEEISATIVIEEDYDLDSAVKQLAEYNVIQYKGLFRLFAGLTGGSSKITQGTYIIDSDMDYRAILNGLGSSSSNRKEVEVTITEGMTVAQIFKLLEEKGVSTVEKLEDMAANHDYAFSFLQDIPLGDPNRLEGYLFPDTYIFYMGEDAKYVINKMLVNFDSLVDDDTRQTIWDKGYSIQDILIIASMIEKETDGTDRTKIASVIYNRLNNSDAGTNGYLQIDATIQYVLEDGQIVSSSDYYTVDSLYNTYLYKGLPPGPISNPGLESIMAAINPDSTGYYYYALGDDGVHHFFSTYSEFLEFLNS